MIIREYQTSIEYLQEKHIKFLKKEIERNEKVFIEKHYPFYY